jgi:hypothetical protein
MCSYMGICQQTLAQLPLDTVPSLCMHGSATHSAHGHHAGIGTIDRWMHHTPGPAVMPALAQVSREHTLHCGTASLAF